ncbi:hypothetical protein BGX30_007998, partial [Mortierella sp. GBA39]
FISTTPIKTLKSVTAWIFIYEPRNHTPLNGWDGARERDKDREIIRILQRLMNMYNPYARRFKTIGEHWA